MNRRVSLSLAFLGSLQVSALCADWLHYRGPTADGAAAESLKVPASGRLPLAWKANVGVGTSSVVVRGNRLYTQGHEGGAEFLRCLDVTKGTQIWEFHHPVALDPNLFEGGSRATPTLSGDSVYALSHEGHLHCLDASSGALRWQRHLVKEFGARRPGWGFSGAPLVADGRVYVDCGGIGGSTVALDAGSGQTIWKSGSDQAGYASPLILNVSGKSTLVVLKASALVGLDPENGREFWRQTWKTSYDVNAATPLQVGADRLLITSGYNAGASLVSVDGSGAREVWRNKNLRAHINSPVIWGDAVFGIDGNTGGGNLVCLDAKTGERRWEEKSVKGGALIVAGGALIVISEKGDLVIAEANPREYRQLVRQTVLTQRCWAQPVLSSGKIFVRDNQGNLVCLSLY